jgi:hypothetical protein
MRKILIGLCLVSLLPIVVLGAMSDAKAALEVYRLWGPQGFIALKPRVRADSNWTRQIGFLSPGCEKPFTVVGEGFNTWDAAFAALPLDKGIQGMYSGLTTLRINVDTAHMSTPARVQVVIDGMPYGDPIPVPASGLGDTIPNNHMDIMFDSRAYADGYHVLCGLLSYVDATAAKVLVTNQLATMFVVKQVPVAGNSGPAPRNSIVHLGLEGWPPSIAD